MASRGPLLALCAVLFLAHCVAADWSQVYPSGYAPAARKFHSAVMQGSDVFFFGGTDGAQSFNDTFSWNIESSSVTLYTPASSSPKERHLHSAVQLAASATHPSGAMVIFAGHLYAGVAFANDMWAWDYAASTWTEVIYNNSPPPPRAAHAAALQGTLMYVYGGTGPNATDSSAPNITYDDLWVFNMTSRLWTQLQTTADIGPRTGIVGGMHGHTMYLYGGQDGKGYPYGDFWALDTSHLEWTLLFEYPNPDFNSFYQASIDGDSYMMFGGTNTDESNADLWTFDINSSTWSQDGASSSVQPNPVSGSAGGPQGNQFAVFGGANLPGGSVIADFFVYQS